MARNALWRDLPVDDSSSCYSTRTSSTVQGPGAIAGKFIKAVGEWSLDFFVSMTIRMRLGTIERTLVKNPRLLRNPIGEKEWETIIGFYTDLHELCRESKSQYYGVSIQRAAANLVQDITLVTRAAPEFFIVSSPTNAKWEALLAHVQLRVELFTPPQSPTRKSWKRGSSSSYSASSINEKHDSRFSRVLHSGELVDEPQGTFVSPISPDSKSSSLEPRSPQSSTDGNDVGVGIQLESKQSPESADDRRIRRFSLRDRFFKRRSGLYEDPPEEPSLPSCTGGDSKFSSLDPFSSETPIIRNDVGAGVQPETTLPHEPADDRRSKRTSLRDLIFKRKSGLPEDLPEESLMPSHARRDSKSSCFEFPESPSEINDVGAGNLLLESKHPHESGGDRRSRRTSLRDRIFKRKSELYEDLPGDSLAQLYAVRDSKASCSESLSGANVPDFVGVQLETKLAHESVDDKRSRRASLRDRIFKRKSGASEDIPGDLSAPSNAKRDSKPFCLESPDSPGDGIGFSAYAAKLPHESADDKRGRRTSLRDRIFRRKSGVPEDLPEISPPQSYDPTRRILISGTRGVGKSTFIKQIQAIAHGFSPQDAEPCIDIMLQSTICSLKNVLSDVDPSNLSEDARGSLQCIMENNNSTWVPCSSLGDAIKTLWDEPAVRRAVRRAKLGMRSEPGLESADYFFDSAQRIFAPDYEPIHEDIVRFHIRTSGIQENCFQLLDSPWLLVDTSGDRSEHKKLSNCYRNTTAVVFVVALSDYNKRLYEDSEVNRMEESLTLFESTVNSPIFTQSLIVLLFNKIDMFVETLESAPLKNHFIDYSGEDSYDAYQYFERRFLSLVQDKNRSIITKYVCAINAEATADTFKSIQDEINQHHEHIMRTL